MARRPPPTARDGRFGFERDRQIRTEIAQAAAKLIIEHGIDDLKDVLGRAPAKGFEYGPKGSVKDLRSLKEKLSIAGMEIKGRRQFEEAEAILRNLFTQIEALENEKEKKINQLTRGLFGSVPASINK